MLGAGVHGRSDPRGDGNLAGVPDPRAAPEPRPGQPRASRKVPSGGTAGAPRPIGAVPLPLLPAPFLPHCYLLLLFLLLPRKGSGRGRAAAAGWQGAAGAAPAQHAPGLRGVSPSPAPGRMWDQPAAPQNSCKCSLAPAALRTRAAQSQSHGTVQSCGISQFYRHPTIHGHSANPGHSAMPGHRTASPAWCPLPSLPPWPPTPDSARGTSALRAGGFCRRTGTPARSGEGARPGRAGGARQN